MEKHKYRESLYPVVYNVRVQQRTRKGCDNCKTDPPTVRFEGTCGEVLWFCKDCINTLQRWTNES